MSTRKEFIKQMLLISGASGIEWTVPESILRAIDIEPAMGSSYLDAEHVVILMQENRSFDHCYGALQGVRGFNDRHTFTQPNGNSVWTQADEAGNVYAPFHFDIKDSKVIWMGSIPHSRQSQIDAWNYNEHNRWIDAKRPKNPQYSDIPLTMGHFTRTDLPFHYAMADAFTLCDQNFSSLMGPTRPNRLFLFTGTNRSEKNGNVKAILENSGEYQWKTMPEWLEQNGISWRIYQNDLAKGGGLSGEERLWLANLGASTNAMEVFSQFNVDFFPRNYESLKKLSKKLPNEIEDLTEKLKGLKPDSKEALKIAKDIDKKQEILQEVEAGLKKWSPEEFEKLSQYSKNLYNNAFVTNKDDPDFRSLIDLKYLHGDEERSLTLPKGDMFYQFRKDVESGNLPTVSWITPSARFSDHPAYPWYGAWFVSEVLDILTQNPETWKKTIFILTYDENDGYFDHIVPFTAPDPANKLTGRCSPGVNESGVEYVYKEQRIRFGEKKKVARTGPIGLGFRVPMVIASPWSRGGKVCSQVFDHTSVLQFLEKFINKKYGKEIEVSNISNWRRTVCGDLTSAFNKFDGEKVNKLDFLNRDKFAKQIYEAQYKEEPRNFSLLSQNEIDEINANPRASSLMSHQEEGSRASCGLPYELYVDGEMVDDKAIRISMAVGNEVFGKEASGSPFKICASIGYVEAGREDSSVKRFVNQRVWDYAILPGDRIEEKFSLDNFKDTNYKLEVFGPNGFYRSITGSKNETANVDVSCEYERSDKDRNQLTGNAIMNINNKSNKERTVEIIDKAYGKETVSIKIPPMSSRKVTQILTKSHNWYDFEIKINGVESFSRIYAGRVEDGSDHITDPAMS